MNASLPTAEAIACPGCPSRSECDSTDNSRSPLVPRKADCLLAHSKITALGPTEQSTDSTAATPSHRYLFEFIAVELMQVELSV